MNRVALLIGGNLGDRHALIEQATVLIGERIGTVAVASHVYESEPWGPFEADDTDGVVGAFLNRALLVDTALTVREVLRRALEIEAALGRVRPATQSTPNTPVLHTPTDVCPIGAEELPGSPDDGIETGCPERLVCPPTHPCGVLPLGQGEGWQPRACATRTYHSRPMDIDIIFWNDEVIDSADLQVPHPRAHLRRFVLEPLCEIMPSYRHPVLGVTVEELLARLQAS